MISKLPNSTKVFKTLRMPNIRRGCLNVRSSCCPWEVAAEADPRLQLCGWGGSGTVLSRGCLKIHTELFMGLEDGKAKNMPAMVSNLGNLFEFTSKF